MLNVLRYISISEQDVDISQKYLLILQKYLAVSLNKRLFRQCQTFAAKLEISRND